MNCAFHPTALAELTCGPCQRALCATCAIQADGHAYCADCFTRRIVPPVLPVAKVKSPLAAGFFSLVLPGLGQVYNGLVPRGLAQFLIVLVTARLIPDLRWFAALVIPSLILFWIWQVTDAVGTAHDINRLGRVPDEDEAAALGRGPVPGFDGSRRTLGVFLVVAGVLLLLHEFGIARALMSFVDMAWPWALLVAGAWLLWQSYGDRRRARTDSDLESGSTSSRAESHHG